MRTLPERRAESVKSLKVNGREMSQLQGLLNPRAIKSRREKSSQDQWLKPFVNHSRPLLATIVVFLIDASTPTV